MPRRHIDEPWYDNPPRGKGVAILRDDPDLMMSADAVESQPTITCPVVEFLGVEKRFRNGVHALGPLDLEIRRGEFTSLVGASGCGKSTALRMIAGLSSPSSGELRSSLTAGERTTHPVGYVFQEPTLLPWSRVWDNVYLPLRLRGASRRNARDEVESALEQVGLADFAQAYPRQLSGGMKMRVSIARALVTKPALLLMDEPFAALDEQTRFRLNDDLLRLWESGKWTIVFVTHSVYEAVYLSGRVVVMGPRPGRVVSDIVIEGPYPRSDAFRREPAYADAYHEVSDALAVASA